MPQLQAAAAPEADSAKLKTGFSSRKEKLEQTSSQSARTSSCERTMASRLDHFIIISLTVLYTTSLAVR